MPCSFQFPRPAKSAPTIVAATYLEKQSLDLAVLSSFSDSARAPASVTSATCGGVPGCAVDQVLGTWKQGKQVEWRAAPPRGRASSRGSRREPLPREATVGIRVLRVRDARETPARRGSACGKARLTGSRFGTGGSRIYARRAAICVPETGGPGCDASLAVVARARFSPAHPLHADGSEPPPLARSQSGTRSAGPPIAMPMPASLASTNP